MKPNRSIPAATVVPVLVYPESARRSMAGRGFGFVERVWIGENHRPSCSSATAR